LVGTKQKHQTIKTLRVKWGFIAVIVLILWISTYTWLKTWWAQPNPQRWLLMSGLAMVYFLWVLWRGLEDNHRPGETALLPTLGLGNIISITRGFVLVIFCGFLFSPWPGPGWKTWLPGFLFTLAALPDFLDGVAARLTDHVTKLGETLDISIDSIAVLGVSLISTQYGQVPWWYLPIGLARYIFLAGIWVREVIGLPVNDLPFSVRRRSYAGLTMGLFFVILYPVFTPPGTHIASAIFALYLLGGFLWDWLVVIGWLPGQPGSRYLSLESFTVRYLPVILRFFLIFWGLTFLRFNLVQSPGSILLWVEAFVVVCLILGVAGRVTSIAALVVLGLHQAAAPLDSLQLSLIVLHTNLLFLGTGEYSLWPIENRLIYHRIGDSQ
jgi:CDP-diacylglycerol--glycerol-3-phosphate 3-phosphatidyltransferase